MSGVPKYRLSFFLNLNPALWSALLKKTSGFVSLLWIFAMFRLLCSAFNVSIFSFRQSFKIAFIAQRAARKIMFISVKTARNFPVPPFSCV